MPIIPALGRLRQERHELKLNLDDIVEENFLRKKMKRKRDEE